MDQQKKPKRYWLTYLWTFPWDIVVFVIVILILRPLFGKRFQWMNGLWVIIDSNSWFVRKIYKGYAGTTLGHGGFLVSGYEGGEGIDTSTEFHEDQHIEQYEFIMLGCFLLSGISAGTIHLVGGEVLWWLHLALWVFGWELFYVCSLLQAWLRGESPYRGSVLEEAAYSLTNQWEKSRRGGK